MKKIVWLSAIIILTLSNILQSVGDEKSKTFQKSASYTSHTRFNINKISTWIFNDGTADNNPNGNSGFEYPKGTGKTAIFASGFLWGGKVNDQVRVGGSAYRSGLKPGRILNSGVPWQQLQAENPNDPAVRVYRVRPDYAAADLSSEINDGEGAKEQIRAQYQKDWNEWPAQFGAPYTDVNNNGIYEPAVDIPGVANADQTLWFVANDADSVQTKFLYGSPPLGIEMQVTIWGYNANNPLNSIVFKRYKLINKSDTEFNDYYVSFWNDPDLGDAADDFVGCDTILSLGFVYNSRDIENIYGRGLASSGCKLLQGPIVDGLPSDSAIFNGEVIYGKKNLPMTAYYFYIGPDAVYRDPTQGQYIGTLEFYNFLQGKIGITGQYYPIPSQLGGGTTVFPLSGDPVTGEGWIDGMMHPPGDRRYGLCSGPFNMAPGDTQEVVLAQVAAGGEGTVSSLTALSWMKYYSLFADIMYNTFFEGSIEPPKPLLTATELDRQIVLNWGSDIQSARDIEGFKVSEYTFQGYNVYQLASKETKKEDAVKIATFDIIDNVKTIVDYDIDPLTGSLITRVFQHGDDTGIERYLSIKKDTLLNRPLNNGSVYYFAVTSYSYNPSGFSPNNFESEPAIVRVVPQSTLPGVRYEGSYGDNIQIVHEQGLSDGIVEAVVIEPDKLTGHSYHISFEYSENNTFWKLTDNTLGLELFNDDVPLIEAGNYYIIDGMKLTIANGSGGVKQDDVFTKPDEPELWGWDIPSGFRRLTWAGADGLHFEGFHGAIGWASPRVVFGLSNEEAVPASDLKNVLIKFGSVINGDIEFENPGINPDNPPADENFSFAYRYLRGAENPPARPEFAPYIVNTDGGYRFQDFKKSAPLSVWDIDDPQNPKRLAVGYLENNSSGGLLDGRYFPGDFNTNDNVAASGPREWLFIFNDDYSVTPNPDYMTDILNDTLGIYPIMYFIAANRRGLVPFSPGGTGEDQISLHPNKVFTNEDVYSFVAPSVVYDQTIAKEDVKKINVFPNPYYGSNPQEASANETFVTFNHLPQRATIRIFNLAGQLVRKIEKDSPAQFEIWELQNDHGIPVASGIFIVYIEMPDLSETKILKLAVIQRQIIPEFY